MLPWHQEEWSGGGEDLESPQEARVLGQGAIGWGKGYNEAETKIKVFNVAGSSDTTCGRGGERCRTPGLC